MWWYVVLVGIIFLGSELGDYVKEIRKNDPGYQQEINKKQRKNEIHQQEIVNLLKHNISKEGVIKSEKMAQLGTREIKGELKSMDEDWLKIYETSKKRTIYLKINEISSVSIIK
ncbi:MAG TPA: hypothetical protein VFC75_03920 [Erysipelothrix sp.]|nr:hypothetical protein [Erysipelothrix sp.]